MENGEASRPLLSVFGGTLIQIWSEFLSSRAGIGLVRELEWFFRNWHEVDTVDTFDTFDTSSSMRSQRRKLGLSCARVGVGGGSRF